MANYCRAGIKSLRGTISNSRNLSNSRNTNNSRDARKTAGTGEMLTTPIAEGTLAAVGTGATADTLARTGNILYYTLCISHSRESWDINSRKSIGNSMVNSSTRDNWIRECQQRNARTGEAPVAEGASKTVIV